MRLYFEKLRTTVGWKGLDPHLDGSFAIHGGVEVARSLLLDLANLGLPAACDFLVADIAAQLAGGAERIVGVMIESKLVGGKQALVPGQPLVYGQSITDGCIGGQRPRLF